MPFRASPAWVSSSAAALLVATVTSVPDLLVGINAVRNGWVDLAVGDLLGAALMNMLILAGLDMARSSRGRMMSRTAAAHALSGAMAMTLLALAGMAVFVPERLNITFGGVGVGLWAVVAAYFLGLSGLLRSAARSEAGRPGFEAVRSQAWPAQADHGLSFCGPNLRCGADRRPVCERPRGTHRRGEHFFRYGLSSVVHDVARVRRRRSNARVCAGGRNAFGSISFNLLLLAPLDLAYDGSLMRTASEAHVVTCFAAILVIAIAAMGSALSRRTQD